MAEINGTTGNDNLDGTDGADIIRGLGGDDRIDGGDGDDRIEGGDGNDYIDGGAGNDVIDGGDGNDELRSFSGEDRIIGGEGDDNIIVENFPFDGEGNSSVDAGNGNDRLRYTAEGAGGVIDMGAGADVIDFSMVGSGIMITLGAGVDTINFYNLGMIDPGDATIIDFVPGDDGEVLNFSSLVERREFFDHDGFANPFGTGHIRIASNGAGGTDMTFHPFADDTITFTLRFPGVAPDEFTAYNLGGYDPSGESTQGPPITGTNASETIDGTDLGETIDARDGDDVVNAGGGDDVVIGGAGSDTLNGGDGDDVFIFDLSRGPEENPLIDVIDGGAGFDTVRIIGSNQGSDITTYDLGGELPITSIEGLELSGNLGLVGTVAQVNAFGFIAAPNLTITDNALLDPTGGFEVIQLTLPNGGARADLSGPGVFVLNIVSGDGDDTIIGPDRPVAEPDPFNSGLAIAIDVNFGNDTVVAGNFSTRILSDGGNNNFTGGSANDYFVIFGNGDNVLRGMGGDDDFFVRGTGLLDIDGGDGDDVISVEFLDDGDRVIGGAGYDRLILDTGNDFDDYDVTGVTFSNDIEVLESAGQGRVIMTIAQLNAFDDINLRYLRIADGGAVTLSSAPLDLRLSDAGNTVDLTAERSQRTQVTGGAGNDIVYGGAEFNFLMGEGGDDALYAQDFDDALYGGDGVDLLFGGGGNDTLDGGSNVDTAVLRGNRADYIITQPFLDGTFVIEGPDGTDTLIAVEFVQFDDETVRLLPGEGVSVNFETADPAVYQSAMNEIRDFDGNYLGGNGFWLRIGSADINGDGDIDQILVNDAIGRFATVGTAPDGLVYFDDYSWAGETRVAGIYIDPLVQSGEVEQGGANDSQRRFQNDLQIENINRVLGADDYDGDGIWEVYFALTDGTAYLRALMHADGNIRYANYQSEQEVIDYLTANGYDESTFGDWFPSEDTGAGTGSADQVTFVNRDDVVHRGDKALVAQSEMFERPEALHARPIDEWQAEYFG